MLLSIHLRPATFLLSPGIHPKHPFSLLSRSFSSERAKFLPQVIKMSQGLIKLTEGCTLLLPMVALLLPVPIVPGDRCISLSRCLTFLFGLFSVSFFFFLTLVLALDFELQGLRSLAIFSRSGLLGPRKSQLESRCSMHSEPTFPSSLRVDFPFLIQLLSPPEFLFSSRFLAA